MVSFAMGIVCGHHNVFIQLHASSDAKCRIQHLSHLDAIRHGSKFSALGVALNCDPAITLTAAGMLYFLTTCVGHKHMHVFLAISPGMLYFLTSHGNVHVHRVPEWQAYS